MPQGDNEASQELVLALSDGSLNMARSSNVLLVAPLLVLVMPEQSMPLVVLCIALWLHSTFRISRFILWMHKTKLLV